jgi:hypothetical protein
MKGAFMAASSKRTNMMQVRAGSTGRRIETGVIAFDSDAAVSVPTSLKVLEAATFTRLGAGGGTNACSVNMASGVRTDGKVAVNGAVAVAAASSSTDKFLYTLTGY